MEYPTIDHKTPIIYGFKHKLSPEQIGSIDNLCFTKRRLNNEKYIKSSEIFKEKLEKQI